MDTKRFLSLTVGAAMLAALAASCSGNKSEQEAAEAQLETDLNKPAEVVFFAGTGATEETYNFRVGDSLRKKFPQYTITQLKQVGAKGLEEAVTTGAHFDILFHSIGNFESMVIPYKLQYDHSELMQKHKVDLSGLDQTSVAAIKQASGGKFYGLPVYNEFFALFYNKTLFDKFGVPYPKDNMTWDQLVTLSKTMTRTDSGTKYYGYTQYTPQLLRANPLSVATADSATNTPNINKEAIWKRLIETYFIAPTAGAGYVDGMKARNGVIGPTQFLKDRIVAMLAGQMSSVMIQQAPLLNEIDWDVVSFPTLKENPGVGSQGYPVYFGITQQAKNKDVQMNVLKYLISEEFQIEQARKGITPVMMNDKIKQEFGKDFPTKGKNLKALFVNKPAPIPNKPLYDADLITVYESAVHSILLEKVDLNTGLRQAEEQATKKIAEYLTQNK